MNKKRKRALIGLGIIVAIYLAVGAAPRILYTLQRFHRAENSQNSSEFRAFQQQDDADCVVLFWHWDSWTIQKPPPYLGWGRKELTKAGFKKALQSRNVKRDFIVCILDKRMAPPGKDASLEELEIFLRDCGFSRVVIQQAISRGHPDGIPILRDTAENNSNL